MNEFCIEWIKGAEYASVTVPANTALKNKLERLTREKPDEVKAVYVNDDGSALFHIPVRYVKVSPPRQLSEKQKEEAGERLRKMREEKQKEGKVNE